MSLQITQLPKDTLFEIFKQLDMDNLRRCKAVCKLFQEIANTPALWNTFYKGYCIPDTIIPPGISKDHFFNRLAIRSTDQMVTSVEKFLKKIPPRTAGMIKFNFTKPEGCIAITFHNPSNAPISLVEEHPFIKDMGVQKDKSIPAHTVLQRIGPHSMGFGFSFVSGAPKEEALDDSNAPVLQKIKEVVESHSKALIEQESSTQSAESTGKLLLVLFAAASLSSLALQLF